MDILGSYWGTMILWYIMVLWHLFHSVSQSKIDTRQMHPSDHWKQCHFRWLLWRLLVFRYPMTAIRGPLRLDHVRHVSIPLSMEGFMEKTCRKPEFLPLNTRNLFNPNMGLQINWKTANSQQWYQISFSFKKMIWIFWLKSTFVRRSRPMILLRCSHDLVSARNLRHFLAIHMAHECREVLPGGWWWYFLIFFEVSYLSILLEGCYKARFPYPLF